MVVIGVRDALKKKTAPPPASLCPEECTIEMGQEQKSWDNKGDMCANVMKDTLLQWKRKITKDFWDS